VLSSRMRDISLTLHIFRTPAIFLCAEPSDHYI
jgi:hypothetical protein